MTDQPIKGYRTLDQTEIDLINEIKSDAAKIELLVEALKQRGADGRWVAIGVTHLQQGFMALTRAVAKPTGF